MVKILLQGKSGRAYCILSKGVPLLLKTSEGVVEPTDPVSYRLIKTKALDYTSLTYNGKLQICALLSLMFRLEPETNKK